jgi:hypothetical protein
VARVPKAAQEAAERWGHLAEGQAHKYGLPNGATLLLKIAYVESGLGKNLGPSSAGARGWTQFTPETRAAYIRQYHVDPWKNVDEAFKATAIFMQKTGLGGYNPGSSTYIHEVLSAPVSSAHQGATHPTAMPPPASTPSSEEKGSGGFGGDLMHIGLVGVLVIGGVGMIGLGAMRMLGTAQRKGST